MVRSMSKRQMFQQFDTDDEDEVVIHDSSPRGKHVRVVHRNHHHHQQKQRNNKQSNTLFNKKNKHASSSSPPSSPTKSPATSSPRRRRKAPVRPSTTTGGPPSPEPALRTGKIKQDSPKGQRQQQQRQKHVVLDDKKNYKNAASDKSSNWQTDVTASAIKLELCIACRKLPNKDSFCAADAFCGIWQVPSAGAAAAARSSNRGGSLVHTALPSRQEREVGRTEVIRATGSPVFATRFRLDYHFAKEQTYCCRIYNEDLRYATDLREHDFLGGCYFTLGELLSSGSAAIVRPLRHAKSQVIVRAMEIDESREVLEFRFAGQELGMLEHHNTTQRQQQQPSPTGQRRGSGKVKKVAKDIIGKLERVHVASNDAYYFCIEKLNKDDQSWNVVWKSPVIVDSGDSPTWEGARLPLQAFVCNDGFCGAAEGNNIMSSKSTTTPLRIGIFNSSRGSATPDTPVGHVETTLQDLVHQAKRGIPVLPIMTERKNVLGWAKLEKNGSLKVLKAKVEQIPSFVQYLAGGCDLELMVAVDCTAQGMHLHQMSNSGNWWNEYEVTLHKVGSIYEGYNHGHSNRDNNMVNQRFSLWGYGGHSNNSHQRTHQTQQPLPIFVMKEQMTSAHELVEAYQETMMNHHYGTYPEFLPGMRAKLQQVIQTAIYRSIQSSKKKNSDNNRLSYTTLVILSSGAVNDVQETIDEICAAAEYAPLSIVLVGIGEGIIYNKSKRQNLNDATKNKASSAEEEPFAAIRRLATSSPGGGAAGLNDGDEQSSTAVGSSRGSGGGGGGLRHSNGVPISQDIVHFCAARDFAGDATACASEALRRVPEQMVQHFLNAGTKPLLPPPPTAAAILPDFSAPSRGGPEIAAKVSSSKTKTSNHNASPKRSGDRQTVTASSSPTRAPRSPQRGSSPRRSGGPRRSGPNNNNNSSSRRAFTLDPSSPLSNHRAASMHSRAISPSPRLRHRGALTPKSCHGRVTAAALSSHVDSSPTGGTNGQLVSPNPRSRRSSTNNNVNNRSSRHLATDSPRRSSLKAKSPRRSVPTSNGNGSSRQPLSTSNVMVHNKANASTNPRPNDDDDPNQPTPTTSPDTSTSSRMTGLQPIPVLQ